MNCSTAVAETAAASGRALRLTPSRRCPCEVGLGHPTRPAIVDALADGELDVTSIHRRAGYALVPGLIYLFGAPVYLTMGTSLATMIPLAIVGGGIKLAGGYVAIAAGSLLAGGNIVGAQIGAAVIKRFKPTTLKLILGAYFGVSIW